MKGTAPMTALIALHPTPGPITAIRLLNDVLVAQAGCTLLTISVWFANHVIVARTTV